MANKNLFCVANIATQSQLLILHTAIISMIITTSNYVAQFLPFGRNFCVNPWFKTASFIPLLYNGSFQISMANTIAEKLSFITYIKCSFRCKLNFTLATITDQISRRQNIQVIKGVKLIVHYDMLCIADEECLGLCGLH